MLWYKAWLETRVRFLLCLLGAAILSPYAVYSDGRQARPETTIDFYYSVVHGGHEALAVLWVGAISFLAMGGLLREKAVGAASFTLALPLSRARLMGIRIGIGLIQGVILILVPSAIMCAEATVMGKPYPLSQVWFHFVLLISGGLVFFAIAVLTASLVEGEYTASLVSFCVVIGSAFALRDPPGQKYSPFHFMGGSAYFDRPTGLLIGPIPWLHAAANVLLAALLLAGAVRAIQAREF